MPSPHRFEPCTVEELMAALRALGPEHALRTAALLRRAHPSDKELQLAGLVHGLVGDTGEAAPTAEAVRGLLGERVARLVRLRVPARRYLAAVEPGAVPAGSGLRGGPMSPGEAAAFEADPLARDAVALCRATDDAGRAAGPGAGVVEDWRELLERAAQGLLRTPAHSR
ncbi:metal-dependent phosphohydrolase [Streptomyces sp. NPDC059524]|uniref:metal-dependent phosphohydrolase n=1 Tax=Streptomyces sp. NPDC059524 TaxID=3346856 RepID=UPI0036A25FCD